MNNGSDALLRGHIFNDNRFCIGCGLSELNIREARIEHDCFGQCQKAHDGVQCPEKAEVGIHAYFWPGLDVQKKWGRRQLLSFIIDVRVCAKCFPLLTPRDVVTDQMWKMYGAVAQANGFGTPAQRNLTTIEPVDGMFPPYVALRQSYKRKPAAQPKELAQ